MNLLQVLVCVGGEAVAGFFGGVTCDSGCRFPAALGRVVVWWWWGGHTGSLGWPAEEDR